MALTLAFREVPPVAPLLARAMVNHVGRRPSGSPELPDKVARVARHRQSLDRLAAYDRVCGFTLRDHVPPTWLHVQTFGLQAALLAERSFPFAPAGLVHVANTMTLHRPVGVAEELDLMVRAADLRSHAKGALFDLVEEVRVRGEIVWSGRSTYLARLRAPLPPAEPVETRVLHKLDQRETGDLDKLAQRQLNQRSQTWRLPADLGRQYAAVSGDVNPIHLSAASAKLLGFKRAIAHGMWTHARCLAALEGRLPETYTVAVSFTKPILLPGRVGFAAAEASDGVRFAVLGRGEKPHLRGTAR